MILRNFRPNFSVRLLVATVALCAHVPDALADVFEVNGDGQWQQLNRPPAATLGVVGTMIDAEATDARLPPVRLSAITTLGTPVAEPVKTPQPIVLGSVTPRGPYAPVVTAAAQQFGISPALVDAVMWQESRYNPKAVSSAGAIGLMQLMPGTARHLGVDPKDPWQNVFGGAAYLRQQLDRFGNNVPFALAAYNAGPGAVSKYRGIPPYSETRNYVNVIMQRLMTSQGQ